MKQESPYVLAEETVDHVTDQCSRIQKLDHESNAQEKVRVLNYLRTVRTTIELMELQVMEVPAE